jgi:hypothetical protein
MATVPSTHRQEKPNAFARQRDARLLWLLARHPATARMLVEVGFFRSRARAGKRLRRLAAKKQLRLAGTVLLKDGRPEHVYCQGSWVKADNVLHEVQLSRVCFKIHADEIRRGPSDVDRSLRPDAEIWIKGQWYFLEFDRGTMSYQNIVETRFAKYRACEDIVLWVCSSASRMEGLRSRAAMLRETALFTTLDQALRSPHAMIWMDFDGEKAALPRGGGGRNGGA